MTERACRSTIQDLSNILGALYLAMLFLAFINSMSVQKVVAYERSVSYRETAAGMYSNLPFALAACSVEVPYILAQVSASSSLLRSVRTRAIPPPPPSRGIVNLSYSILFLGK